MASENIIMAMVKAGASRQVCICNIVTGRVSARRDQNKHPEWNGMAGSSQKQWLDAGLKNTIYTRYLLLFLNSYILRQPKQFCLLTFFNFASDRIVTRRSAFCPRSLGRLSRSRAVIMIWLKESRTVNTLLQFTVS